MSRCGCDPYPPRLDNGASEIMERCIFDITKYGAKGNGTNDDWAAIQEAAEAAIANGGGTIYFPSCAVWRNRTQGQAGILLNKAMNIRVLMGWNSIYLQDNMAEDGTATANGIFVKGKAENIWLQDCDIRYKSFSTSRQTHAPIFAIGDNINATGTGAGAWYRGTPGGENPTLIAQGAIKNFRAINCYTENSPSVMIGLAGVDGSYIQNFRAKKSWADGLYHLYVRHAQVVGAKLEMVSDDALSISSYESDTAAANIWNDFHGEDSAFTNIIIDGIGIEYNGFPSGGIALLGCRDLTVSNFAVRNKFRGVRFEYGTALSTANAFLSTLANRNCTISNGAVENSFHVIAGINKEVDFASDPKWFDNDVTVNNIISDNADNPFVENYPLNAYGDAQDTGNTIPAIFQGFKIRDCVFLNHNDGGFQLGRNNDILDCFFDGKWSFNGYTPYRGDLSNSAYPDNNCQLRVTGNDLSLVSLKRCTLDMASENAQLVGIGIFNCADLHFTRAFVKNTNRSNSSSDEGGIVIDDLSERIVCEDYGFEQDDIQCANALSINNKNLNHFSRVKIKTDLNTFYHMVFDLRLQDERISQCGLIEWLHTANSSPRWAALNYLENQVGLAGDVDFDIYPENSPRMFFIDFPVTATRAATIHESCAGQSDVFEIVRTENATGAFNFEIYGQAEPTPEVVAQPARGTFLITGGTYSPGVNTIQEVRVNGVNILPAPINWGAPDFFNNNNDYTANQIAIAIAAALGTYTAQSSLNLVTIESPDGATYNGYTLTFILTGDVAVSDVNNLSGGLDAAPVGPTPSPYLITALPAEKTGCRIAMRDTVLSLLELTSEIAPSVSTALDIEIGGGLQKPLYFSAIAPSAIIPPGTSGRANYINTGVSCVLSDTYTENASAAWPHVTSLIFWNLVQLGCSNSSGFNFGTMASLTTLGFPALVTLSTSFQPSGMASLTSIDLSALETVTGTFAPTVMASLTTLSAANLKYIGNSLSVGTMALLTTLDLTGLEVVGNGISLGTLASLVTLSLDSLSLVGNTISFTGTAGVFTTFYAPVLRGCGQIILGGNALANVTIGSSSTLKEVTGNVTITNAALTQASVDHILVQLSLLDGTNGTTSYDSKTVNLSGGTSSTPSATGLAAKVVLQARGCTVTNN